MKNTLITLLVLVTVNGAFSQNDKNIANHLITQSKQFSLLPSAQLLPKGAFQIGANYWGAQSNERVKGCGWFADNLGVQHYQCFDNQTKGGWLNNMEASSAFGVLEFLEVGAAFNSISVSANKFTLFHSVRLSATGRIFKQRKWVPNTFLRMEYDFGPDKPFSKNNRFILNAQANYQLGKRWFTQFHVRSYFYTQEHNEQHKNLLLQLETKCLLSNMLAVNGGVGYDVLAQNAYAHSLNYFPGWNGQFGVSVQLKKQFLINCSAMYGHLTHNIDEIQQETTTQTFQTRLGIEWFLVSNK